MSFGDFMHKIGDAADAIGDIGSATLGVVMDVAKSAVGDEVGSYGTKKARYGDPYYAAKQAAADERNRAISQRFDETRAEHKSTSGAVGAVRDTAVSGTMKVGSAMQYVTNKGQRGLTTWQILNGDQVPGQPLEGGVPGTVAGLFNGSVGTAWDMSNKVTPGQALGKIVAGKTDIALGGAEGSGAASKALGIDGSQWDNIHDYGERGNDKFSPWFSFGSGAADIGTLWYADPWVVAGKASVAANRSKTILRAGDRAVADADVVAKNRPLLETHLANVKKDLAGAEPGTDEFTALEKRAKTLETQLSAPLSQGTGRQRRVGGELQDMVAESVGQNKTDLLKHKQFSQTNQGAALATIFSQLDKTPDGVRQGELVWGAAQGSQVAKEALVAERADISFQIDRFTSELDDLVVPQQTWDVNGNPLTSFEAQNSTPAMDALKAEIKSSNQVLDQYDRMLGAQKAQEDSARVAGTLIEKDQLGVFGAANGRRAKTASRSDLRRAANSSSYTIQNGIGGVPLRVWRAPVTRRAHGNYDWHEAEATVEEHDRVLKQVRGLDPAVRSEMLDNVIGAQDDASRQLFVKHNEAKIVQHVGAQMGYKPEDIQKIIDRGHATHAKQVQQMQERGYGFASDGSVITSPLSETQLANWSPSLDVPALYKMLKREKSAYAAGRLNAGFDVLEHMGDQFNDLWKLEVLFRGGYIGRNLIDSQLRIISVLGARQMLAEDYGTVSSFVRTRKAYAGLAADAPKIGKADVKSPPGPAQGPHAAGAGRGRGGP